VLEVLELLATHGVRGRVGRLAIWVSREQDS
jgi:hypothetical protein